MLLRSDTYVYIRVCIETIPFSSWQVYCYLFVTSLLSIVIEPFKMLLWL